MDEQLVEQAMRWRAATARDDCDWQKFTLWLEASPAHRQAYDDVAMLEEGVALHQRALQRAVPAEGGRGLHVWRRAWIGAAMAAGMALVALIVARPLLPFMAGAPQSFAADAGAGRTLSLDGGIQVVLAPGSAIQVEGDRSEQIRLDGSAYFDVTHDPDRELRIAVGPYQVRDIGTRFELVSSGRELKVAVAEGQVGVVLPGQQGSVAVRAGQRLLVAGDPAIAEYGEAAPDDVGSWRAGRLVFRNEPLSLVAPEVGRHAGVTVTVDPAIAQRRFSGVFAVGDGTQLVDQLGRIMGIDVRHEGTAVHLSAAGDSAPGR